MSTLKEKSQNILDEKNAKILPENIKDGVQVFNVVGSMKHSIEGNFKWMKSFNTIADAEASNEIGYDEKVFIYGGIPVQIEQEAQVTSIYLPKTIVLPSAVTTSINITQEIVSDHGGGGGSNNLTPTEFMLDFNLNMNMLMVIYKSTDGITYRRTDLKMYNETVWGDMWDMVDDVAYIIPGTDYSENYKIWYKINSTDETEISLAKEFFKQIDYTYGGMLQNVGTITEDRAQGFRNLRVNRNNSTDRADYTIDHEIDWCVDVIKARKVVNAIKAAIGSDYTFFKVKVVDDNTYIAFGHSYISSEKIRIEPLVNMSFADIDGDLRFHLGYSWNTASTTQDNGIIVYKGVIGEDGNAIVTDVTTEYTIETMELGDRTYKYIKDFLEDNVTYSNVYYGTDVTFEVENMIFNNEPYSGYSSWYFFQGAGKTFTLQPVDLT